MIPRPARGARLIDAIGLAKSYADGDGRVAPALRGVDLELAQGEFVALVGPSGSGKSTLLALLGTLLRPDGGSLRILGEDLGRLDERGLARFRNRNLGFVFQFHHLLPDLSALENVAFPAALRDGRETAGARRRAAELLDRVGLADRLAHRPGQLSGGQRQRVAAARALMNRPALVLADEPTGSLDRDSARRTLGLMRELNREDGAAFVVSTHDDAVAASCGRTVAMVDGRIADDHRDGQA